MSAKTKQKIVKVIEYERIWFAFEKLGRASLITETQKRELFWKSLPAKDQNKITEECPYFDPQHAVWTESDSTWSARAMGELSLIMIGKRTCKRGKMIGRVLRAASTVCTGSALVLFMAANTKNFNACGIASMTLMYFAVVLYSNSDLMAKIATWHLLRIPESCYEPVCRRAKYQQPSLSSTQCQYLKNWAVAHNWRCLLAGSPDTDLWFWKKLASLIHCGKITSCERRQIFWDTHPGWQQLRLIKASRFFNSDHEVWSSGSPDEIRAAKLDIDLVVITWAIRHHRIARNLWAGAALGVLLACSAGWACLLILTRRAPSYVENVYVWTFLLLFNYLGAPAAAFGVTSKLAGHHDALRRARREQGELEGSLGRDHP